MRTIRATALQKIIRGIVAAAPLAVAAATACGGATTPDGSGGTNESSSGSSGTSGSSGASGTSGNGWGSGGCGQAPKTFRGTYRARICDAGTGSDDANIDAGDASADAGQLDPSDPASGCESEYSYCNSVCGATAGSALGSGDQVQRCDVRTEAGGGMYVECTTYGRPCGRRHEGLAPLVTDGDASIGSYLADSAYVEDASVASFEILAEELRAHGAPERLVRAAQKSARDERRHTRVMTALARRQGATPPRAAKPSRPARSLEAMLIENAIEGCVGETYGALLASYQGVNAEEPRLRAAMRRIAEDETGHAALAWQIAAWAETKLDAKTKERIRSAQRRALDDLTRSLAIEPPRDIASAIGLPSAAEAKVMLASLARELDLAA